MPNLSPEATFESTKNRVLAALRTQFPIEGKRFRLDLLSLVADERAQEMTDPHHVDNVAAQLTVKNRGDTWSVPVKATLRRVDKQSGQEIDRREMILLRIPKLTRRYSYIIDGYERQHDSVFRSKPRPYHLIANNGEIVGKWENLARGKGFVLKYDPAKGYLSMKVGTSTVSVLSVLQILGVPEASIVQAWGPEIMEINRKRAQVAKDLPKLVKAFTLKGTTPREQEEAVRTYFKENTEVWPGAMKSAFGKEFTSVTGEALLLSTKRLIAIQRGRTKEEPKLEELPDDRQSLSEKYLTTTEDFMVEALEKSGRDIVKKIEARIDDPEKSIDDLISAGTFTKVINRVFDYAQRPDQSNPLGFVSGYMRTTIRGSAFGGVGGGKTNLEKDQHINPSHLGFLDPIQTPESEDTGIALHLPLGVETERSKMVKGQSQASTGQELFIRVYDIQTKAWTKASPSDLEGENVAYPDQVQWVNGTPRPIAPEVVCYAEDRRTAKRPWAKVRYVLPSAKALFSFSANLVPFLQNNSGNRAMMAAKQQEQAISLVNREAPLVQVKTDADTTFEEVVGSFSSHKSPVEGVVTKIEPEHIHINSDGRTVKVPVYHNFPLNGGKTMITSEPVVKVGQKVAKGDLLADTNFSKNGKLALGANIRVAFLPWKGLNFEDGIVVSETAARTFSSSHLHQESITIYPGMIGGTPKTLNKWQAYTTPERSSASKIKHLDANGIVKEGTIINPGDVLVAALTPAKETREDQMLQNIGKSLVRPLKDSALVWDHDYPGEVVRVVRSRGLQRYTITVHIKTSEPLKVGDKLAGRHGNKGIVSRIVPDHKMPHDKAKNPVHILLNPAGVPSRMNVGQVLETAASKIAKKTGKPYIIENFTPNVDYTAKVKRDLNRHGLSDTEELLDPETGRSIGQIMVGDQYMLKLHHTVEKKETARSYGTYSGAGDAPSGSGIPGGGQKLDMLSVYGLLAHGSKHNLREAYSFKSDGAQDAVWDAVVAGRPLPPPESTTGMKNFLSYLKAMGINPDKRGDEYVLLPLTDDHVLGNKERGIKRMSNGAIPLPDKALYAKSLRTIEEAKGLFDRRITGGMDGEYWSHIDLGARIPNPVFEPVIQILLGMKGKDYAKLVGPTGVDANGRSGFDIIVQRLASLDVDKELVEAEASLATANKNQLNLASKRVRYLKTLKDNGISPLEAYTNKVIPVVPPKLRKVSVGLDGTQMVDDLNTLYHNLGQNVQSLKNMRPSTPPSVVHKIKSDVYEAVSALRVTGMNMGGSRSNPRHHTGLMEKLTGKVNGEGAPKRSYFQKGVLSRRQDLSGRSTIVPEPDMNLDEVGIPVSIAMEMYKPFIARHLTRNGYSPLQAIKQVDEKTDVARRALDSVIKDRPVMLKRDPALHKFSIMGFNPKLVDGKAIKIHPLVTGGFNADFDGDSMALYVPVSDEAVDEVKNMLPSKNLFSPTHFGIVPVPGQDSLLGIFQATKWGNPVATPTNFTPSDALRMLKDGKLKPDSVISIKGKKTTPGRISLASVLPPSMREDETLLYDPKFRLDKKNLKAYLSKAAKEDETNFARVVDHWKDLGNELSYLNGSSFSLNDFHDGVSFRDYVLRGVKVEEEEIRKSRMPAAKKDKAVVDLYNKARKELKTLGERRYQLAQNNRVWEWKESGARGDWAQFSQLVFGPMLVTDPAKKEVPVPITKSYGEGLSLSQYWASMHGARKGSLDRSSATRDPGALTKDIINTGLNTHITAENCGTTNGAAISPDHKDAPDRFLAKPIMLKDGTQFAANTVTTPEILTRIQNSGITSIVVRSPLHCEMRRGICATCFGLNERGVKHSVGTNIGVIAGHALGEPVTQLTMRTFHTGGAAGSGTVVDSFKRAKQLFMVPGNLPDKAILATTAGIINSVQKDVRGGYTITIGTTEHRVVTGELLPSIKKGASVRKGDPLSTGPIDPHDLLKETKNLAAVRGYLTSEIDTAYGGMTRRRNIETVVKSMTNITSISSAPPGSGYIRGQTAPLAEVEDYNKEARENGRPEIKHEVSLRPMTRVPLEVQEDWLAKLNYRELKKTYVEGTAQAWKSDIHGHPIAGIAHGAEFGTRPFKPLVPRTQKLPGLIPTLGTPTGKK